jgi:hypothetical protein
MLSLQNKKYAVVLKQQSTSAGATFTTDLIDTLGFREVEIIVHASTSDNATNNPSVLKVMEADTTDATNLADISGYVGDTDYTIPASPTATTTAPFAVFNIPTQGRKRYFCVKGSPLTTQTFSVIAILGRPEEAPNSATEQNVAVVVKG